MASIFLLERDPGPNSIQILSKIDPTNPFYTSKYAEYRRRLDQETVLFLLEEEGQIVAGYPGFITSGRLNKQLEIPSMPGLLYAGPTFWEGVERFCREARVTGLSINSFASLPGGGLPDRLAAGPHGLERFPLTWNRTGPLPHPATHGDCTLWVAGWGSGPAPPKRERL